MSDFSLGWGICSAGKISQDFSKAVCTLQNHKIHAVAARSKKDAQRLADQVGAETAYEGYDSLAADPNVGKTCVVMPWPRHGHSQRQPAGRGPLLLHLVWHVTVNKLAGDMSLLHQNFSFSVCAANNSN